MPNFLTTTYEHEDDIRDEPSGFKRLSSKIFLTGHGVKGGRVHREGKVTRGVTHDLAKEWSRVETLKAVLETITKVYA